MGKAIESIAQERGHEIVQRIGSSNSNEPPSQHADVVIEFSLPSTAVNNIDACINAGIPVIVGTTGWFDELEHVSERIHSKEGAMLYASNFSVGVNLFFALNSHLAQLMQPHTDYDVSMTEIHHTAKVDAPSGTAVTLAEGILNSLERKSSWVQEKQPESNEILIESVRQDPAPGTHSITYSSDIDDIEIKHTAKSRKGFALGAILAAEYLVDKEGLFTMKEVLGLS